jgi:hypothetical protein
MKIERGVMAVKDGQGWQETYSDGKVAVMGWGPMDTARISDPRHCKKTTDLTYKDSPYTKELESAQLLHVERRTETIITTKDTEDGTGS